MLMDTSLKAEYLELHKGFPFLFHEAAAAD
jgi:hypothetical protein